MEGLTEAQRREIYAAAHRAGMLATYQAEAELPIKDFPADVEAYSAKEAAHHKIYKQAKLANLSRLCEQHGIDTAHLARIQEEGQENRWPIPDAPNPY